MGETNAMGRATKQSIVASAAAAFAHRGFYGTSLRSIAREAGVDHSTLLHHFGNKTALLLAVVEWHDMMGTPMDVPEVITAETVAEVLAQVLTRSGSGAAIPPSDGHVAEYIADRYSDVATRNAAAPGLVQLLSILTAEAGAPDHPARETLQRRHEVSVRALAAVIRMQRASIATLQDDLTPEDRAAVIIATWEGLQMYDALHPGQLDVPALVRASLREAFGLN